jgi:hypothetical protein
MPIFFGEKRKLGYEDQHRDDECSGLSGTCCGCELSKEPEGAGNSVSPVSAMPMTSRFCKPIGIAWR